jgi:hypothetical protein
MATLPLAGPLVAYLVREQYRFKVDLKLIFKTGASAIAICAGRPSYSELDNHPWSQ